jgi:hypothetical protein
MPSGHGWRIWIRPDPDHGWMEPVIAGPGADVGWDGQEDAELSRRVSVTASRPAPRFECYVRVSIQTTRCSRASALVRLARRQRDHTGIGGNGRRSFPPVHAASSADGPPLHARAARSRVTPSTGRLGGVACATTMKRALVLGLCWVLVAGCESASSLSSSSTTALRA